MIRPVKISDAEEICGIYNYYIANSTCTFETEPIAIAEMQNRIESYTKNDIWIIYEDEGKILGYSYAKKWHQRSAYRFTLETSVYVSNNTKQKGIGSQLYKELIFQIKRTDCHALLAIISLPNDASVKMHEKFGFIKSGH